MERRDNWNQDPHSWQHSKQSNDQNERRTIAEESCDIETRKSQKTRTFTAKMDGLSEQKPIIKKGQKGME